MPEYLPVFSLAWAVSTSSRAGIADSNSLMGIDGIKWMSLRQQKMGI